MKHPLFSMSFAAQCRHFSENHNPSPRRTGEILSAGEWTEDSDSLNSMLRRYLTGNGLPFINDYGRVWFCRDGLCWESVDTEIDGDTVTYHIAK